MTNGTGFVPDPIDLDKFARHFQQERELPPDGIFEIGLVLAGTASAGPYTAGVLDMLIEAFDAWSLAKQQGSPQAPPHTVKLRVAAGTSGGGVSAAILARALSYRFPHVTSADPLPENRWADNPFYNVWVNKLDAEGLLATSDLDRPGPISAILNGNTLDDARDWLIAHTGDPLIDLFPEGVRPYVENPLTLFLTLGNTRGIPYALAFEGGERMCFARHSDFVRFACDIGANQDRLNMGSQYEIRPDEFFVYGGAPQHGWPEIPWARIGEFALGTSAFPLVFPPASLFRPVEQIQYRAVVVPGDGISQPDRIEPIEPAWEKLALNGLTYSFDAVDGGTFNNEPVELARTFLAGLLGQNPRDRKESRRAIVLIDPLVDFAPLERSTGGNVLQKALGLVGGFVGEGRYRSADLLLMADKNVFSRFLVRPSRDHQRHTGETSRITGDRAIASSRLQAFLGFLDVGFRHHDFLLGQRNCWQFLRDDFGLDRENPLFHGWSDEMKNDTRYTMSDNCLPIIPLVKDVVEPAQPVWPQGSFTPQERDELLDRAENRFRKLIPRISDNLGGLGAIGVMLSLLKRCAADEVRKLLASAIDDALKDANGSPRMPL